MSLRRLCRASIAASIVACRTSEVPNHGAQPLKGDASAVVALPSPDAEASSPPSPLSPPAPLSCLVRHYVGRAVRDAMGWSIELPDGKNVPWDDGRTKTPGERLDRPDLEDALSLGYPKGEIAPVTDEAQDPGRVRVELLFRATYGATAREVSAALVDVKIAGRVVRFHRRAAQALGRVATRLEALLRSDPELRRYFRELGGTFNTRTIAGTERTSAHAWGIAIDIDTSMSDYWQNDPKSVVWKNRVPQSIVDAFEAESFVWGGRWFHYDTMHFEWRPELFDAQCRARGSEP